VKKKAKPAKRSRSVSAKRVVTKKLRQSLFDLARPSSWWIIETATGESCRVPDAAHDRWFAARARGLSLLGAQLGRTVSQDGVTLCWSATRPGRVIGETEVERVA
jgi:hypothetical protein